MRGHIISRCLLKNFLGVNKKILLFDPNKNIFWEDNISSKNKYIAGKDFHKLKKEDSYFIENERAKIENYVSLDIQTILKYNNKDINNIEPINLRYRDYLLKFFIIQSFSSFDNEKNNENMVNEFIMNAFNMLDNLFERKDNLKSKNDEEILKMFKKNNVTGNQSINYKFKDFLNNKGSYFEKYEILKNNFDMLILEIKKFDLFITDKVTRFGFFSNPYKKLLLEKNKNMCNENYLFSLTDFMYIPISKNKCIFFANKKINLYKFNDCLVYSKEWEKIISDHIFIQVPTNVYIMHPDSKEKFYKQYLSTIKN